MTKDDRRVFEVPDRLFEYIRAVVDNRALATVLLFLLSLLLIGIDNIVGILAVLLIGFLLIDRFEIVRRCVVIGGAAWTTTLAIGAMALGGIGGPVFFNAAFVFNMLGFVLALAVCVLFFCGRALYYQGYEQGEQRADRVIAARIQDRLIDNPDTWDTIDGDFLEVEGALNRARDCERKVQQALRDESHRKDDLVTYLAHDLRTPLTSISGNADVLLDQGSTGTAVLDAQTRRGLLLSIRSDAQWLNATVENLLAITKLEGGGMHLSTTLELMDDIVEEALRHVSPAVREHDLKVVACDEPALVNVDARLMVQLVVNLVNNAITYTPAGSHIMISISVDDGRVACSVADDGPGIAPEDRERIFESFYTANHGLADSHRSVGLGLSLCRSIALAHGGSIEVAAADPHGSVFTIELPVADVSFDKE